MTVSGVKKDCADFQYARNELVKLGPFTCNACNGHVFVRGGIPGGKISLHFAHQTLSPHCMSSLHRNSSSNESTTHSTAKEMIFNCKDDLVFVLQSKCETCNISEVQILASGMVVELEKDVSSLPYRFDLLFTNPNAPEQWFAVEVVHKNPVNPEKIRQVDALGVPMKKKLDDGTTVDALLKLPTIVQVSADEVLQTFYSQGVETKEKNMENEAKRPLRKQVKLYDMFYCERCNRCQRVLQQSTPLSKCIRTEQGIIYRPTTLEAANTEDEMHEAYLRPCEDITEALPIYDENKDRMLKWVEPGTLMKVQAIAGAGKSTVIKEYVRRVCATTDNGDQGRIAVLMYNRAPRAEMKMELSEFERVDVHTIDSFLWNLKPDMTFWEKWELPDAPSHTPLCIDTVKHKNFDPITGKCPYCNPMIRKSLGDYLASGDDHPDRKHCEKNVKGKLQVDGVLRCVKRAWRTICSSDYSGPYTTSIVCKLLVKDILKVDIFSGYRFVIIDEAQDLSNAEGNLFLRKRKGVTCICVGDEMQNINGFRGAGDCFERLRGDVNIKLPCTWRFAYPLTGFVEMFCRKVVGIRDFQALSGTQQKTTSVVQTRGIIHFFDLVHRNPIPAEGVHCLFRYNADILLAIFDLVNAGHITENTMINAPGLMERMGDVNLSTASILFEWCKTGYISQQDKSTLRPNANYSKNFDQYLGYVQRCRAQQGKYTDMYIMLKFVTDMHVDHVKTFRKKIAVLQKIIQREGVSNYKFMTAHSSKGFTYDTVYVDEGMVSRNGKDLDRQELNLLYVALTRASHHVYIHDAVFQMLEGI